MIITIPFKTPTINKAYWHHGNIKMITKVAREIREKIIEIVNADTSQYFKEDFPLNTKKLAVTIEVYEDWYFKNGNVRQTDIANREKFLIDSIFKALGIDDRYIFMIQMIKKQSKEEKAIIKIEVMDDDNL